MSAEAVGLVRTFRVGRYRVTLTFPPLERGAVGCFTSEWSPRLPHRLSAKQWRQYRAGRDRAIAEFAAMIGISVLVVE